jgi:putative endonuclease
MYYCYVLRLSNNKDYIGFSADLKQRVREHEQGKVLATKKFIPVKLIYYSAFVSKKKALDFEKYLKTASGFAFRNKRLV